MTAQGRAIGGWGPNVKLKVPVTYTACIFMGAPVAALSKAGVVVNVTALMPPAQVAAVADALDPPTPAIVSVFAGRIADTGRDPIPVMTQCRDILRSRPKAELLWASPRELLNIVQADAMGCHIITVTHDLLAKPGGLGTDLDRFSLENGRAACGERGREYVWIQGGAG